MNGFTVELFDRSYGAMDTGRLALAPVVYSAQRWGGPARCEVAVTGDALALWDVLNWLRYWVLVRNPNGQVVWWGYVLEALVGVGAAQVGLSLEPMTNRVAVAYTTPAADGNAERATTGWGENASSVAAYGAKEALYSLSDTTAAQAEALRATVLAKSGTPVPGVSLDAATGAVLVCCGVWETLGWEFYAQAEGQELHDVAADLEHMLGWGIAAEASRFGFYENKIGDLDCEMGYLLPNNRVEVADSAFNDGTYLVESPADADATPVTYASDGITFGGSDDIYDSESGFDFIAVGNMITTSGSAQTENNSTWWVSKKNSNSNIEVDQHTIVDETSVGTITVKMGHEAVFDASFAYEVVSPSNNISLTAIGIKVAQKFRLASGTGWTVTEASVPVRKVGSPADNLRVRIFSDSAGNPGSALATGTVAGNSLSTNLEWVSVSLGAGVALSAATDYWLVVDREGALDWDGFYGVGLESAKTYARGDLKIQLTDLSWATRDPDGHLPFQLYATRETTTQIEEMLGEAQFVSAVSVGVSSGVTERPYRAGDLTIREEVERLLGVGTSAGGGLVAAVDTSRVAGVSAEPTSGDLDWLLAADGRLLHPMSRREEPGLLPVGQWVRIEGIPASLGIAGDLGRFLVDIAEYDVRSGRVRLTPRE